MFDRVFFERTFHEQVRAFAREHKIDGPIVEFLLDDGTVLYIRSVLQTKENWLCLLVHDEEAGRHIYCLYYSIKRITLFPAAPKTATRQDLRFRIGENPHA